MADPVFRTTDGAQWGTGLGRNLHASEVDQNFWDLLQRIVAIETSPPSPNDITNISVVGSQMLITLGDATTFGPFTLPTAFFAWKGEWLPGTAYQSLNLVTVSGSGVYIILHDIESASEFDPAETDSEGPIYILMFGMSGGGGDTGIFGNRIKGYVPGRLGVNFDEPTESENSEEVTILGREIWAEEVFDVFVIAGPSWFGRASLERPPSAGGVQLRLFVRGVADSENDHTELGEFQFSNGDKFASFNATASEDYVTSPGDRLSLRIDHISIESDARNLAFIIPVTAAP